MSHGQKRYFCGFFKNVFQTAILAAHSDAFEASRKVGNILMNSLMHEKCIVCMYYVLWDMPSFVYGKKIRALVSDVTEKPPSVFLILLWGRDAAVWSPQGFIMELIISFACVVSPFLQLTKLCQIRV